MRPDDLSYLANRVDAPRPAAALVSFHYADTDEEFGVGTLEEFDALKALGYIDPSAVARPVQEMQP